MKIKKCMCIAALLTLSVMSAGCGATNNVDATVTANAETSVSSDTVEENTEEVIYVHGDEGYFSLLDNGSLSEVKEQFLGTCWAFTAASIMESSWKIRTGEGITIDPKDIVDTCLLSSNRDEGLFLFSDSLRYSSGGHGIEIVYSLTNGFGDYYLAQAQFFGPNIVEYAEDLIQDNYMNYSWFDYDRAPIQEYIREYGPLEVFLNHKSANLINGYYAYNGADNYNIDHVVMVVGWDDNFPRDNFYVPASQDGAWLMQNTFGSDFGEDGYYWVSYDTPMIFGNGYILLDDYEKILSYDSSFYDAISLGESTTVANHFKEAGQLKAVGTFIVSYDTKIHVEILDKDLATVLYETDCEYDVPGYYTVFLDELIDVEDYYVAITYYGEVPVEGNCVEELFSMGGFRYYYSVSCEQDQSYVLVDGEWLDLYEEETMERIGFEGSTNNCCIKAIY